LVNKSLEGTSITFCGDSSNFSERCSNTLSRESCLVVLTSTRVSSSNIVLTDSRQGVAVSFGGRTRGSEEDPVLGLINEFELSYSNLSISALVAVIEYFSVSASPGS
jgi:hypothetical protein